MLWRQVILASAAVASTMCLVSCTNPKRISRHSNDAIFLSASDLLGRHVSIKGYLHWTLENKNIFPVWASHSHPPQKYCLPILVKKSNVDLQSKLRSLDGSVVVVDGVIAPAAPRGMISVTNCKQIGVEVTSVSLDQGQ